MDKKVVVGNKQGLYSLRLDGKPFGIPFCAPNADCAKVVRDRVCPVGCSVYKVGKFDYVSGKVTGVIVKKIG